jgi:hypothetical protein
MGMSSSFRPLTAEERSLIEHLLAPIAMGKHELRQQLKKALVRIIDDDGSLEFKIETSVRIPGIERGVVTEGEFVDVDGGPAHVLLHVVDGKIKELEFYKEDRSQVICLPAPSKVEVLVGEDERKLIYTEPFRDMQPKERELIRKLLEPMFPGRDELAQQLETAKVRTIDNNGSLEFMVSSPTKASRVKYAVPTEGEYEDPDGVTVHVLLRMLGDKVKELEFYREDNGQVQSWPDPGSVRVFAPQ